MTGERPRLATPTEREREFGFDELFFSTTDRKGVILSGNRVFARVAGRELEELKGRAHNIIRHPDMPRGVFRLLWEFLDADRPVAGYVKNLASDGSHYWVLATLVPAPVGYLSVRLKPSTPYFAAAQRIYGELLALEHEIEGDDVRQRKPAIEASVARLGELLAAEGFTSYEDFMHAAVPAEVLARETRVAAGAREPRALTATESAAGLVRVLDSSASAHDYLDELVRDVGAYDELSRTLAGKSRFISTLSDRVRLFALNALIAATRLGDRGAALSAVAELMGSRSREATPIIEHLDAQIVGAVELLGDMGFRIAIGKLQAEMIMVFARELLDGADDDDGHVADLSALLSCLTDGSERVISSLTSLDDAVGVLASDAARLQRDLDVLGALQINGRVEAARADGAGAVRDLFATIAEQVTEARGQMLEFRTVGAKRHLRAGNDALREDLDQARRHIAALSG